MKKLSLFALLLLGLFACDEVEPPIDPKEPDFEGYTLAWSDEFNGSSINDLNWVHELGDGTAYGLPAGWGNSELQLYTNAVENSYIEEDADGVSALVIAATESSSGDYNSAKLTTQSLHSFRYGKIDARIKLPTAQGMWPAMWMLGDNITDISWPGCGEIDILELVGSEPDVVRGNIHYTDEEQNYSNDEGSPLMITETFDQDYHNFGIDWTPTEITFSLDGSVYKTTSLTADGMKEFQRSFYLILNVAVGGNWPGDPDATTTFPQKMYVDYIRYYSKDDFTASDAPALVIEEETVGVYVPPSISQYAFNSTLNQFSVLELKVFGSGGEPEIFASGAAIEGDSSLLFSFPGGSWGGGWFDLNTSILDMSAYSAGNLVFSIKKPATLTNAEIKLEALTNDATVFLADYTPTTLTDGYVEYTIPLSDFIGLDFTEIKIPFAIWNPIDATGGFTVADVFLDNIHWVQ